MSYRTEGVLWFWTLMGTMGVLLAIAITAMRTDPFIGILSAFATAALANRAGEAYRRITTWRLP